MKIWRSADFKMGANVPDEVERHHIEFMFLRDAHAWNPDQEINEMFLRSVIQYMAQLKAVKGIVFLNDFLNEMGLERISAGQTSGWLNIDPDIEIDRFGEGYRIICWVERDIHLALDEDAH